MDEKHARYNMPFHWHKEMELIRILKGHFLIKVEDEEIYAQAGDLILIHEGAIHGGTPES
ncbi:MAG: AraC family ligand binding domain-containing protein [Lacrimispora sp.]